MKRRSEGTETRYDDDLGGNHIDRLRKQSPGLGVFLKYSTRLCSCCAKRKPTKGGSRPGKAWMCACCKDATSKLIKHGEAA